MSGARGGHVGETFVLVALPLLQLGLDPAQQAILVGASGVDRRQQQLRPFFRGTLEPDHQLSVVAARLRAKPRNDHVIELQSLGLVDGHHVESRVRAGLGRREQRCKRLLQVVHLDPAAVLVLVREQVGKELLRVRALRFR